MAYRQITAIPPQFEDANGNPLVNGTLEFYLWNTTTPVTLYSDSAGTALGTSCTLNSLGMPQTSGGTACQLFGDDALAGGYKLVIKNAAGSVIPPTIGPVFTISSPNVYELDSMSSLVSGSIPTGVSTVTVKSFHGGWDSTVDGPKGESKWHHDGTTGGTQTTDSTSAIQTAMASGRIVDSDGRGWVMTSVPNYYASSFGATSLSNNSDAVNALLTLCAARKAKAIIDVHSTLTNITVPTYADIEVRADLTHSSTSTHCFNIANADFIKIDFGKDQGFSITRSGNKNIVKISGASDYSNKKIGIGNMKISGGSSAAIDFYAVDDLTIKNIEAFDFDGQAVKNTSNLLTNPYYSRKIKISKVTAYNLTGSTSCTAIAINSPKYVYDVYVSQCDINGTDHNGIEVWAVNVWCWGNTVNDAAISISFGACRYLHCWNNKANVSTPATTGYGGIGIEVGGCTFFNVHHNQIRGHRVGINTTETSAYGLDEWYSTTDLLSVAGTLDPSDTNQLMILTRDSASGLNLAGSYVGILDHNIIMDSLNAAVYARMDTYTTNSVKISGNIINRVGRYDTPTENRGALYLSGGVFDVHNNTIEDTLKEAIYNIGSRVVLGPNTIKKCDASQPVYASGAQASFNMLTRLNLSGCTIAGPVAGTTPTQGTWFVGDTLYSHTPAAGGSLGIVCTDGGTFSTTFNSYTATTISGSGDVVVSNTNHFTIGSKFTIAGVTGTKTITDINYSTNTLTVDVACDASVSGAAVTNATATFKALPSIAA